MYRAYFIDDEPLVLGELIDNPIFTEHGYQVVGSSTNPIHALKEIRRLNPDVVFTDLSMPECSGVDLVEKLRFAGSLYEFVIISAYPEFAEQRRFFLLGGFDYLLKPVSDENLHQLLDRLSVKLAVKKGIKLYQKETASPDLNRIVSYLKENIHIKHTLESVSEAHFVNTKYVCQLFSGFLGTTFTAYLTMLRMEEAARLLRDTKREVKEISYLCGFTDYFYFCRVFRKHHACTPSAYREGFE